MRPRVRRTILLVFAIVGGFLLALIVSACLSSSGTPDLAFHFLAGQEPWHQVVHQTPGGEQTVVVYCLTVYHDTLCHTARQELLPLGYKEVSVPIRYGVGDYRFDPRYRLVTSEFRREGRTSVSIRIGTGRFLEARPDGGLSFSPELDWVNVVIRQTRASFSLRRELRSWWDRLFRKGTVPRAPPVFPPVPVSPPMPY